MTNEIKQTILDALEQFQGDDYERAKRAFRGFSKADMQKQFGQSGETCQQVLDGYREHAERVAAAKKFIKSL